MDAKKYLYRYTTLLYMKINKQEEIEILENIATGTTAQMGGERVQSSGNQEKMATAVGRVVDLQAEIAECDREMKEITDTIELLKPSEYNVLHKRYIQNLPFKTIGSMCGFDESWATTTNGRALQNLQKILDSRETVTPCDKLIDSVTN